MAYASPITVVDNALGALRTAFREVDGVIVNRRRTRFFASVLSRPQR